MTWLQNYRIAKKMKKLNQPKKNDTKDCWHQYIELIHQEAVGHTENRNKEWQTLAFVQKGEDKKRTVWLDWNFSNVAEICNICFHDTEDRDTMADESEIHKKEKTVNGLEKVIPCGHIHTAWEDQHRYRRKKVLCWEWSISGTQMKVWCQAHAFWERNKPGVQLSLG